MKHLYIVLFVLGLFRFTPANATVDPLPGGGFRAVGNGCFIDVLPNGTIRITPLGSLQLAVVQKPGGGVDVAPKCSSSNELKSIRNALLEKYKSAGEAQRDLIRQGLQKVNSVIGGGNTTPVTTTGSATAT